MWKESPRKGAGGPRRPERGHGRRKERPKTDPRGLQIDPKGPKMAPRGLQGDMIVKACGPDGSKTPDRGA